MQRFIHSLATAIGLSMFAGLAWCMPHNKTRVPDIDLSLMKSILFLTGWLF